MSFIKNEEMIRILSDTEASRDEEFFKVLKEVSVLLDTSIINGLKEIEFLARKKFGDLDPNSAFTHFVKEIGEILTAKDLDQFVKELFDVLAMGYSVVIAHGKTHNDFLELFSAKMQTVKERMKR